MSENTESPDEPKDNSLATKENQKEEETKVTPHAESISEEPAPKEKPKPKEKKPSKTRKRLTVLQAAVLETIRDRPQRPRAIQTIIRGVGGVEIPRNDIVRSLNELKKKGLVDKISGKAWQAK